jgi:phosphoglycerate dehydrogenase-like enzyme
MVASPLQPELVDRLRDVSGVTVVFEPDLLPVARFPNDHSGDPEFRRTSGQEERWASLVARADATFGVPGESPEGLRRLLESGPRVRWVQGTSAGAGQLVRAAELDSETLRRVTFTSSVGVHASQLAEWALLGLLHIVKDVPRLRRDAAARRWPHYPVRELRGQRLLVVGLGHIGRETARLARAFGMHVTGVRRQPTDADLEHVDATASIDELAAVVPTVDAVVLSLPATSATDGLFSAALIDALPAGAALVNVGRGTTVDEPALVRALESGRLAGAALDVFATEPLPADSPLWHMDNALVSPHTAALSEHENDRIVDLVVENLVRFRDGRPLLNTVDVGEFY